MPGLLGNRRALVTGASTGIGAAVAQLFGAEGACVGVHYRQDAARAETVAAAIRESGGEAHLLSGDLQDPDVRRQLIDRFVGACGGIDILVNNAGACYGYHHFAELTEESWDLTFTLNAKSPFFLSRHAFAYMKPAGWGRIINISSVAPKYASARSLHYAASKAALETLTVGFAREGASSNILVNAIRCGVIETGMHTRIDGYSEALFRKRVEKVPLKRAGAPADVARLALFLVSSSGDFITGESFTIAGGD
jgi:3-oxoacyl-[acyl-carrier protein] reductase